MHASEVSAVQSAGAPRAMSLVDDLDFLARFKASSAAFDSL